MQIATTGNNEALQLGKNNSNDGNIVTFRKQSTTFGSIGTVDGDLNIFATASGHKGLRFGNGYIAPTSNSTSVEDDAVDLGLSTQRFKDLHLSGTITFGDSHTIGDDSDDNLLIAGSANENIIIDSADDIILDADGADILFKDGGTLFGKISKGGGSDLIIDASIADKDIFFTGTDGTSAITALTLDMSNAGAATFNDAVTLKNTLSISSASTSAFLQASSNVLQFGTSSDDPVVFFENNAEKMRLTSGNLGLGTSSPAQKLDVVGAIKLSDGILSSGQAGSASVFNEDGTTADFRVESTGNTHMLFVDGGLNRIGIGTSSPDDELDVEGADPAIRLTDTSASGYARMFANNGSLLLQADEGNSVNNSIIGFDVDGTERARIDSSGRLGLGTTSPNADLHLRSALPDIRLEDSDDGSEARISYNTAGNNGLIISSDEGNEVSSSVIAFKVDASEKARIDDSGNFGLGTSSPACKFNIVDASSPTVRIKDTTNNCELQLYAQNSDAHIGTSSNHALIVDQNNTERLRIATNGSIGINQSSPSSTYVLDVGGAVRSTGNAPSFNLREDDSSSQHWQLGSYSGVYAIRDVTAGTFPFNINSSGNIGLGNSSPSSLLHLTSGNRDLNFKLADSPASGDAGVQITAGASDFLGLFAGSSNGELLLGSNGAEKMRLDASGNLLVNATSQTFGEKLHVTNSGGSANTGMFVFSSTDDRAVVITKHAGSASSTSRSHFAFLNSSNTEVGSIKCTGSATAFNTSSDARLKDVTGSSRGLDVINNLNPVAYNWKADNHSDEGLIAQEVEELVPNAVNQNEDGYYQMDYSKLVTHLVKGMQEQQEQIESLKSEIANLKGE